jgi:hypothetical protein
MSSASKVEKGSRDEFDKSFDVPLAPSEAWPLLMDIPRLATCIPGAQLTEVMDDSAYQGNFQYRSVRSSLPLPA